ncbi:hypothetical protein ACS0TY_022650 [Phlomoides rotata]
MHSPSPTARRCTPASAAARPRYSPPLPARHSPPQPTVARCSPSLTARRHSSPFADKSNRATGLLAIAVGINQKRLVNQIVKKFLSNDFSVMLFHYDGVVDEWHGLDWSNSVVHVSVSNQTKWRFLHPDIVADYDYIFLWDEDLIVDNFHPAR